MAKRERSVLPAVFGLWQLFVLHEALAGPPVEKREAAAGPPVEKAVTALNLESNASRPAGPQLPGGVLDLRPPAQPLAGDDAVGADAHRKVLAAQNVPRVEASVAATPDGWTSRTASLDAGAASGHIMSPMEALAHNFRRDGLPVARLFENKDSLVHLGLNQKGKPGLWILHKVH